ncbi:MAG: penicillin-binding transpeptidase domain-containing protein [Flavobacteriaceae bacterium]|nr:penicillin-binding transpeptidase domain-containing protein [Flavobacteriaceae bacterium]
MISNSDHNKPLMPRFYLLVISLSLFAFVLIGKLIFIQFYQNNEGVSFSSDSIIKNVVLEPSRGNIYASDGNILATSISRYELHWDAMVPSQSSFEKNKAALADSLALMTGTSPKETLNLLNSVRRQKNRYWLVAKNISYSEYMRYKSFPIFNKSAYRGGLIVEQQIVRENPLGKIAERTIGYELKDKDGTFFRVGLEGAFSQYLRGNTGLRLKQKIANGQWKPISDSNEKEPTEGYDLHTTIDVNIQDIAHNALLGQLEKFEAEHGTVVVMEVKTGAIKAIANLGRTDNGKYFEKLNYAVGEAHEPGSTFKLMGMIAALEDKVVDVDTEIDTGNGEMLFYGKYKVKDSKRGGYGTLSAAKAFEVSSNVGLVKIVYDNYKNNPKQFVDRLYNMGINKPLGLPIRGEGLPKIPYPSDPDWDGLDLPWMAYGYGVAITPLQTLAFYNAIANDGEMVKPKFLEEISNFGNVPTKVFSKQILNPSICSVETLEKVQGMMFNVVDKKWGTGYSIKDPLLSMAGKTGTCQVDYTSENVQYIASFVGYFPAEEPKYSCIVVIHRPDKTKGYYGATVAAPVFKTVAKKIYNDIPHQVSVKRSDLIALSETTQRSIFKTVPDVAGMSQEAAKIKLEGMGFTVVLKGQGKVINQSIKPGAKIQTNQKIILELS